ncbi:MAG: beta strand repeat-containing protein, partial [Gemmatimonadota bacterium]
GNPIAGAAVLLAATGTNNSITQPGLTDAGGVATGTLSSTVAAVKTVSATINSVAITQTATISVTPAEVSTTASTVVASPTSLTASTGGSFSTIAVTVKDAFGNSISGATVTLAATGTANVLIQPADLTSATGVATGTLSSTMAETKTISATVNGSIALAQTATVTVSPAGMAQVGFIVEPSTTAVGAHITPAVQVSMQDPFGNTLISGPTRTIALTLATNPGGGTLSGTTSVQVAGGSNPRVAVFSDLSINQVGAGYRLRAAATSGSLDPDTSTAFDIGAGAAATIGANGGGGQNAQVGTAVAVAPSVIVRDASANPVLGVTVTFAVASGGGSVTGATQTTNAAGIATVGSWTLGTVAGSNTMTATAAGSGITGNPVTFSATGTPGPAAQLTVTTHPSATAQSGAAFAQQPTIQLRDGSGNPVSQSGVVVTAEIATGSGTLGGTLTATTSGAGVATFTNLSITGTTGPRTLSFSASGVGSVTSTAIDITAGAATQLAITTQPSASAQSGVAFPQQPQIQLRDAAGNDVSEAGVVVTASIATGDGALGGTATATTNASGIATFTDLSIGGTIGDRTLRFSAADLTSATSSAITITAGVAAQLVFTVQPSDVDAGQSITPAVEITVQDAFGNTVTGATTDVTLSIVPLTGTPLATLSGGGPASASGGVAVFSTLSIDLVGLNYQLQAAADGLTGAKSSPFNVLFVP